MTFEAIGIVIINLSPFGVPPIRLGVRGAGEIATGLQGSFLVDFPSLELGPLGRMEDCVLSFSTLPQARAMVAGEERFISRGIGIYYLGPSVPRAHYVPALTTVLLHSPHCGMWCTRVVPQVGATPPM